MNEVGRRKQVVRYVGDEVKRIRKINWRESGGVLAVLT
jgi:hypothetical protein